MSDLICINKELKPWNLYNEHKVFDLSIASNTVIDNREWYNSYMPLFFLFEDCELIVEIRSQIDRGERWEDILESKRGVLYQKYLNSRFTKDEILSTLRKSRMQLKNYFLLEEKIQKEIVVIKSFSDLLGYLHFSLNMMQLFHDPIEALTSGKTPRHLGHLKMYGEQEGQLKANSKLLMFEVLFIPMSFLVVHGSKKISKKELSKLLDLLADVMGCDKNELEIACRQAFKKYNFGSYMSLGFAEKIVQNNVIKMNRLGRLSTEEDVANEIQMINSMMTWSKFVKISSRPLYFRYHTTNTIIEMAREFPEVSGDTNLLNNLETITISGSEKQARLIYLVDYFIKKDEKLKSVVIKKSTSYCTKYSHC